MKVLTEVILRGEFKNKLPKRYIVKPNVLITPSARQFLRDRNIQLIVEAEAQDGNNKERSKNKELENLNNKVSPKYISDYTGGALENKPEHMTQIYGNKLVFKDNPRIIFRGKLDSLQSQILKLQVFIDSKHINALVEELEEVLNYTREILKSEVLEKEFVIQKLIGLNHKQLREMSHHPKAHFGVEHILPDYRMGDVIIRLNSIRSSVREVELSAIKAFRRDFEITRIDIIKALNRLSSCIYIMMCKYKAGLYKQLK